jgi:RND family efflux transporter MFP subunit
MKNTSWILSATAILMLLFISPGCSSRSSTGDAGEAAEEKTISEVTLSPEALKTAGIQTEEAAFRPMARTIHVPGEIVFNPKGLAHITARSEGRIEQLLAYSGERVQKGQILLSLYSQDFLSVQAEYLQAAERFKRLSADSVEKSSAQPLYESAKNKLRILGLTEEELAEVGKTGTLMTLLPVRAPLTGTVIESSLTSGDFVGVGASLFRIADLSTVWADVHIFEKDAPSLRAGAVVVLRAGALPGREFRGRLFQIGSVLDGKTRTVEARVEFANGDGQLRPGMFAEADIVSPLGGSVLAVPAASVQEFQNKKVIFVQTRANAFTVRTVETGDALDGYVEILKGLNEKELVAARGSFFLKSELLKKTLSEE